jgi:hypothetical protein
VIPAIEHQNSDRIPLDGDFRQGAWKKLENHFGTTDAEVIRKKLGLDLRYAIMEPSASFADQAIHSPWKIPDIGVGENNLGIMHENGCLEDEYGICRVPNATGLYWHYSHHPLAEANLDEIKKYVFPALSQEERYTGILKNILQWKKTISRSPKSGMFLNSLGNCVVSIST